MTTKKLLLRFPYSTAENPIVSYLVRDYHLVVNILRARVMADENGYLVIDVTGEEEDIRQGMEFIKTFDVAIDPVNKGVVWDQDKCTHCGNCVTHCPTRALHIPDRKTMRVTFREEDCIECLACLKNCPYGACSSPF